MYDAKIKTETSDGDSTGWYNSNNIVRNNGNSINSNTSVDEKMSDSSTDISEKDYFSKDEEDFSPADLALVIINITITSY